MWARLGSPWVGSIEYTENGESYLLCPSIAVVSAQRWRMVVWGADLAVGLCFGGRRRVQWFESRFVSRSLFWRKEKGSASMYQVLQIQNQILCFFILLLSGFRNIKLEFLFFYLNNADV